jgi:putative transposase
MANAYVSAYIHLTFWKKRSAPWIDAVDKPELCRYIGGIIRKLGGIPIIINGTSGHLHVLSTLPKTMSISGFVEKVKANSSKWMKERNAVRYANFYWQVGYGAFTVDRRRMEGLITYIENQEIHHRKVSHRDEFEAFLRQFNVDFNSDYLCE